MIKLFTLFLLLASTVVAQVDFAPPQEPVPVLPMFPLGTPQPGVQSQAAPPVPPLEAPKATYKEIQANPSLRNKSPFMIPTDLYIRIKKRQGEKIVEGVIDDTVDARLRWPIRNYTLVGILSGVSSPKAIVADANGKTHVFRTNDIIANAGGVVTQITTGEVTVLERGVEVRLKLIKEK